MTKAQTVKLFISEKNALNANVLINQPAGSSIGESGGRQIHLRNEDFDGLN